ncbi:MAG: tetratricopeptide repeat protein, partial [Opitutales bacterium]
AARGVIMAYEQAGLPNKAGKVIRALLVENPFDTELILRLALLEEKRGNYRSATKASEKALELLLNQVPRRTDANSARLAQRNRNVNQVDQFSDLAVRNLISSTRTPQDYWRLLGSLQERIQTEIENLKNNDDLGAAIVENPRLGKLADIIRRIGLLFNQPAEIDALDAGLFRLYPNDSSLRISAASARQRWQTALDAASFMTRHDMELTEDKRILTAFAEGRVAVETMLQESTLSSSGRAAVIVLLTIFGYDELADQVLEDFNLKQTPRKDASLLVAAALATGRHQMARDVILSHLSRLDRELESQTGFQRSRVLLQAASLYKMLVAAWPHLSPEERSSAVTIYGTCIGNTDKASELGASYHFLLASIGRADEIKTDTLREYLKRNTSYLHGHLARIFDSWLAGHPPAERTDAVSKLLESKTGDSRAQTLSLLGAYLSSGALTQELLHEFPELAAPKPEWLTSSGADMNRERERFAKKISVALESGENDVRKIITLYNQVLRPAANMLPPEQLDLLIKDYAGTEDAEKLLIQFLLLRQAGREREALPLLNEFSKLPHEDLKSQMVGAILQGQLSACGWNIQALRLAPQNRSTSKRNLKFDYALQDPLAILDPSTENLLDTSVRRMHASKLMPSAEQFKKAVQIYQADTRLIELANTRRAGRAKKWPSRIPATPGGLLGTQQQRSDSILSDVTLLKDGQNILRHELLTMTTSWVSHEANVCREIAVDASRSGLSAELKRSLSEAAKGSALNLFDLELIDALAQEAPAELPDAVASQMEKVTLRDWKGNHRYDENIIQTLKREEV